MIQEIKNMFSWNCDLQFQSKHTYNHMKMRLLIFQSRKWIFSIADWLSSEPGHDCVLGEEFIAVLELLYQYLKRNR